MKFPIGAENIIFDPFSLKKIFFNTFLKDTSPPCVMTYQFLIHRLRWSADFCLPYILYRNTYFASFSSLNTIKMGFLWKNGWWTSNQNEVSYPTRWAFYRKFMIKLLSEWVRKGCPVRAWWYQLVFYRLYWFGGFSLSFYTEIHFCLIFLLKWHVNGPFMERWVIIMTWLGVFFPCVMVLTKISPLLVVWLPIFVDFPHENMCLSSFDPLKYPRIAYFEEIYY